MLKILQEFQRAQAETQGNEDPTTHDAVLTVDIGGGNTATYRGVVSVDPDDDVVTLWQTMYSVHGKDRLAAWPDHKIPTNADDRFHSEYPTHIRLSHVIVVEWAITDQEG